MSKNVRTIGEKAFCGCSSLSSISFQGEDDAPVDPNTDYEIGDNSFQGCSLLPYFYVANGVTSIGNSAFGGCSSLVSITISKEVASIGERAFANCPELTTIAIPSDSEVRNIGSYAFAGCQSLTSITIPVSVTSIKESTFSNCTNLTLFNIPEGVTTIEKNAFYGCSSLSSITIPQNVKNIEAQAFYGCNSLAKIYSRIQEPFALPNAVFKKSNSGMKKATMYVPYNKRNMYNSTSGWSNDVYIEESAPLIDDYFTSLISYNAEPLETVFHVTSESPLEVKIGDGEKIAFPTGFTSDNIDIPSTFVNEDDYHFKITGIGENAFKDCTALTTLTIPNSVAIIENAFSGCTNLKSVTINWRKPSDVVINPDCFDDIPHDAILYVPAGTAERYAEHEVWSKFAEVVESGPISVGDINASKDSQVMLPILLRNKEKVVGFQFRLTLPDGVETIDEDGSVQIEKTERMNDFIVMGRKDNDKPNSYIIVGLSLSGNTISGDEGAIMNIKLTVDDETPIGVSEIRMNDINIVNYTYETIEQDETWGDLTIIDYILGDVNGDRKISITDAVSVVNFILGNASANFNEVAADINSDGKISITDAVAIVNTLLQGNNQIKEWNPQKYTELIPE